MYKIDINYSIKIGSQVVFQAKTQGKNFTIESLPRVWDQTVAFGTVANVTQFVETCAAHFRGRPCIGYLTEVDNPDTSENFIISHTPVPRKISKACTRILRDVKIQSCPECLNLTPFRKEEVIKDSESNEETIEESIATDQEIKLELQDENEALMGEEKVEVSENTFDCQDELSSGNKTDPMTLKPHKCDQCTYATDNKHVFARHKLRHGVKTKKCPSCLFSGHTDHELKSHITRVHEKGGRMLSCWKTEKTYVKQVVNSEVISDSDYQELQGTLKKELAENTDDLQGSQSQGQAEDIYPKECGACKMLCHNRLHFQSHKCKTGLMYKKCEVCEELVNVESYRKHMLVKHGQEGTFYKTCEWCKQQFSVLAFARHAKKIHFYGMFRCLKKCTFRGNFATELVSHMSEYHPKDSSATCPACKEEQHIQELQSHYEQCILLKIKKDRGTAECEQMCPKCGKTFKHRRGYREHRRYHCRQITEDEGKRSKKVNYRYCDKCGKGFRKAVLLRHHIQSVHDKIEYTCPQCTMTFPTFASLRNHKNSIHSTDENLKCKHCGKQFESVSRRKVHEAYHGEPKFQCRHCPKKVKTAKALVAHERYHTGEKPFKCSVCDSGFVNLPRLRQHERGVHEIEGPRGGMSGWKNKSKEKPSDVLKQNQVIS